MSVIIKCEDHRGRHRCHNHFFHQMSQVVDAGDWESEANERIDQLRRRDVNIEVWKDWMIIRNWMWSYLSPAGNEIIMTPEYVHMSCKPFDNGNNVNWLLSRWWWREAMITVSWPLKSTRSTIFSRLERLVRKNMYFCKIRQLTGVQLNCFSSASWHIQGNWYYPSFASSDQRAVNDKTVGACWQRIFSKKAASSLSLLIMFFCGFMFSEK